MELLLPHRVLEQRFDAKTRAMTSLLFLLSRSMSLGVVISAPAVVLAVVLDMSVTGTVLLIALPTAVYTMFGGVQAGTWTDVKIMVLIVLGLFAVIAAAILGLPDNVSLGDGFGIAATTGRLRGGRRPADRLGPGSVSIRSVSIRHVRIVPWPASPGPRKIAARHRGLTV